MIREGVRERNVQYNPGYTKGEQQACGREKSSVGVCLAHILLDEMVQLDGTWRG